MSDTTMKKKGVVIGCRDVVVAFLTEDGASGASYETDKFNMPGVIEMALTAQGTNEQLGADDITMYEILNSLDGFDVSMTVASVGTDGRCKLLGHQVDSNGVMIEKADDVPPYVAIGFKAACSDGSDDYIWLYKGRFREGDATFRTREKGQVNWQTPVLTGSFAPRHYDKAIRAIVNTGDSAAASILDTFFTSVY